MRPTPGCRLSRLVAPEHIMLCYLGSAESDDVLRGAVELCEESGAELSVLLPVIDSPVPGGCCGIQGEHWRRLMDDETRNAAERAERALTAWGVLLGTSWSRSDRPSPTSPSE